MSDVAISVEGLSKRYLVGRQARRGERYTALRDVLAANLKGAVRRTGDVLRGRQLVGGDAVEEFWALREVCFSLKRGEVLGVIGGNGAGKSTLLKLLSRVTEPTRGRAVITGRVASLLEVGTGFHPELTGRENIYLHGAILGMKRTEIRARFDEIVAFAGTEHFLDTPVKRYSSGMFVRLAFAVAAHLESEIFIVDEVLAVGGAEFQKRCLGKLTQVAKSGRTVLFVSHNMAAIKALTTSGLVLDRGQVAFHGGTDEAIKAYMQTVGSAKALGIPLHSRGTHTAIRDVRLVDARGRETARYTAGEPLQLKVAFETDGTPGMSLEVFLLDENGINVAFFSDYAFHGLALPPKPGAYECVLRLNPVWLASGEYSIDVFTAVPNVTVDHHVRQALRFDVTYCNPGGGPLDFSQRSNFGAIALTRQEVTSFVTVMVHDSAPSRERLEAG